MTINIKVDFDRFTLDDMIAMQEERKLSTMRNVLARCVIDEAGEYLPHDEAKKIVGGMTMKQIKEFSARFATAMNEAKDGVLPLSGNAP